MEARKIIVFDSQTSMKKELISTATVWGDLKAESEMSFENKKVVVKETRVTLENDAAVLPEGEFTVYLFQEKSKYGNDDKDAKVLRKLRKINQKLDILMDIFSQGTVIGVGVVAKKATASTNEPAETKEEPVQQEAVSENEKLEDEAAKLRAEMGM